MGAAVAALQLKPGAAWRHAVTAAARSMMPACSMQQLVQLLLGVTAGGHNPQEHWWRGWFAATMHKCEGLFGVHTGPEWVSSSLTAAAADDDDDDAEELAAAAAVDDGDGDDDQPSPANAAPPLNSDSTALDQADVSSRQQQQAGDELPGALLSTVCMVLLQLGRQVHPLWMAGMLEAYLRCDSLTGCRGGLGQSC